MTNEQRSHWLEELTVRDVTEAEATEVFAPRPRWMKGRRRQDLSNAEVARLDKWLIRRRLRQRQDRQRRNQIRENGPSDRYTRAEIAERDGWMCGICGGLVDSTYRAPDPRAASIDHIVEIAVGGTDTLDNVRLTHLYCNMDRVAGTRSPEQAAARLARRLHKITPRHDRLPDRQWYIAEPRAPKAEALLTRFETLAAEHREQLGAIVAEAAQLVATVGDADAAAEDALAELDRVQAQTTKQLTEYQAATEHAQAEQRAARAELADVQAVTDAQHAAEASIQQVITERDRIVADATSATTHAHAEKAATHRAAELDRATVTQLRAQLDTERADHHRQLTEARREAHDERTAECGHLIWPRRRPESA